MANEDDRIRNCRNGKGKLIIGIGGMAIMRIRGMTIMGIGNGNGNWKERVQRVLGM